MQTKPTALRAIKASLLYRIFIVLSIFSYKSFLMLRGLQLIFHNCIFRLLFSSYFELFITPTHLFCVYFSY